MRTPLPIRTRLGRFAWLLLSLLALLIAGAFVSDSPFGVALSHGLIGLTLVMSIYPVSHNTSFVWAGGATAILAYGALTFGDFTGSEVATALGFATGFVFYLSAAIVILGTVLLKQRISTDELAGAVSVYLLLGIAGAFVFAFVEMVYPGSVVAVPVPAARGNREFGEYLYFSFTCLTTLGFGDLVPATPQARVFAYLEAVIGQVYLTVLVARLVGLHLTQLHSRKD